jgi:HlyD family secretion protein
MKKYKRRIIILLIFIFGAIGIGAYYWYVHKIDTSGTKGSKSMLAPDRLFTVKRGDLIIGLLQAGSINTKKKHKLSLEASYKTKLMWIVEENAKVKKDEILAKFETEELEDKIEDYKIECENNEKEILLAKESLKIQVSTNLESIRTAIDRVSVAEDNLRKYLLFDRRKQRDAIDLKIDKAEEAKSAADINYKKKKKEIAETGAQDQEDEEKKKQELKSLLTKIESAKNNLNNAYDDRTVMQRYTHPNKLKALYNKLAQAKLHQQKTDVTTVSNIIQKKRHISNLEQRLRKNRDRLKRYESYLPMMKLVAPVNGLVIYGDPDRRWGNPEIKLGMDIRRKQVLLTIPDMSNLVVDFDLPEQFRSKVKLDDAAIITPDSIPNMKLRGRITKIASLPVNQIYWDRSSPKIYKSTIDLKNPPEKLVSGMSVQIEIITEIIKKTLFVPIEAVFEEKDDFFVYLKNGGSVSRSIVKVGASNDTYVQILDGVKENDVVYLYRPFQKKEQDK